MLALEKPVQIILNIPDHVLPPQQDSQTLAQQLKLYSALLLFQSGKLSRGAACEFADVDIYTFLAACKQHRIATLDTDIDEIETEVMRFKQLRVA
ncbi:MAG: UPF0175 family protein [Thiothrix sp.]|nr:MAG: UPF0175 family protein [Thiothrix sp.]